MACLKCLAFGSGPNYETMSSSVPDLESKGTTLPDIEKPKVYPIRWFILILFVLFSASNAMQWIQYAIINTTIIDYYGVSSDWVNWTSLIFMVLYIPFIFPASYLLEKLIGIAAGFVIPPMIVRQGSVDDVTRQLYILFIGVAILTSILLVLIIFFFKSAPPTPPSYAAQQQSGEEVSFVQSLKNLLKNRSFIFLLLSYGINVGVFYAISTLLNDIITFYYKGADQDAGRIGLVITVAGMVGSVCCGYVLDRYRKYKETTIVVYAFSLLGMIALTFTISQGLWVAYLVAGFLGFFMTGLLPVGFELGSELTYPEPEGTQAGLLNAGSQIFGIAFTNIYSPIFKNVSPLWANIAMCVALAVGLFLVSSVSSHLKRQAALNSSK
ncbi:histamine transporter isoform X4 [Rhynchophorus ferrugineus]|uniref:histamine transporter isoform X4 n=1 Tax=Rhynchophorus ferrugineus TaxID=354439 RepID=UPI003FCEB096